MRALVVTRVGGPEVVEVRDVPEPMPGPGEELVHVDAVGMNFADTMAARGGYPGTPEPPLVAGREFSGTRATNGERVMGYMQWGAFAEVVSARSALLWPVPRGWSAAEGAAFPVNFFTAYFAYWKAGLVSERAPGGTGPGPQTGNKPRSERARVLIHAVAGGVGTAAVEIGKLLGVEMYGTSSSDEKLERVRELGLEHAINYKQQDYEEAIKESTGGEGVDVVFEMLGGEHVLKSVRCLRDFGRVIVYGAATGRRAELDPRVLYAKGTSVHGLWLTALRDKPVLIEMAWQQLSAWAAQGHLRPVIGHVLALEQGGDAYRLLVEGKNFGKIVLKI